MTIALRKADLDLKIAVPVRRLPALQAPLPTIRPGARHWYSPGCGCHPDCLSRLAATGSIVGREAFWQIITMLL